MAVTIAFCHHTTPRIVRASDIPLVILPAYRLPFEENTFTRLHITSAGLNNSLMY